jgi:hypothetical protein
MVYATVADFDDGLSYTRRVQPVAYLQTILLCLYRLTQLKEYVTFNLIY